MSHTSDEAQVSDCQLSAVIPQAAHITDVVTSTSALASLLSLQLAQS